MIITARKLALNPKKLYHVNHTHGFQQNKQEPIIPSSIDALANNLSDHPEHTSLVVGLLQGEQRSVHGYGTAGGATPTGDTIFEIGSVSKVFTTALLAILRAEGLVALEDPVSRYVDELAGYPESITLQRLATHTAGLPKMPSDIFGSMLRDPGNPYAAYSTEKLLRYLSKRPPAGRRLEARLVAYSNLGMGLLGTLLGRRLGDSYEAAITKKICEPLGMKDTCLQLNEDQEGRLAAPHNARGKTGRNWDLPAFAGAGALKSTANDLLTFLAAHLGYGSADMVAALQECHTVREQAFAPPGLMQRLLALASGQELGKDRTREGMALSWTVGRLPSGAQVHWHHGATGGYRAFVGFVRASQTGAVVMTNSGLSMRDGLLGTTATDRLGFAVLEHLVAAT